MVDQSFQMSFMQFEITTQQSNFLRGPLYKYLNLGEVAFLHISGASLQNSLVAFFSTTEEATEFI